MTVAEPAASRKMRSFLSPETVIGRFVARRTIRSATFVALALGIFIASKVVGYADAYPTPHDRAVAAAQFVDNTGLKALFGTPRHIETGAGFAVWYTIALGVLLGGIWAYLIATKAFRGEEASGRFESLLAGPTTARLAAVNVLAGLTASLGLFYLIVAVALVAVGKVHQIDYAVIPALFLALAAVAAAAMFTSIGALASQLMPTRARAAGLCTALFGLFYLMRAAGDVTSAHWVLNVTPLGWIEKLSPMFGSQPIWLVPIAALIVGCSAATVYLAGRRDLGASFIADKDTQKPRLKLLGGTFAAGARLTRGQTISWVSGMAVFFLYFATLTSTAAKAFTASTSAENMIDKVARTSAQVASTKAFLGVGFLLFIVVLMAYAAAGITAIRSDEAEGYLDNFLVRPVSRLRWLWGRVAIVISVIFAMGVMAGLLSWVGMIGHHNGLGLHTLLLAGINMVPAAIFTLGLGIFTLGFAPRLTAVISYGVIALSFLIELISSGLHLNHWFLDISVLNHVALAPAVDPNWHSAVMLVIIGVVLALTGAAAFNARDLKSE